MEWLRKLEYTPELGEVIIDSIPEEQGRELTRQVLALFCNAGLPISIKHCCPDTPNAYYRILCFIKKSEEAVILNTRQDLGKNGVVDGFNAQVRILDPSTLNNLDALTESVRSQILNAGNCGFCSEKCIGKKYEFTYAGTSYTKCRYLCNNYRLVPKDAQDVACILDILRAELVYKKPRKKA